MTDPNRDRALELFRIALASTPPGEPLVDDDELLTAFRLGILSPTEEERLFAALAGSGVSRQALLRFAHSADEADEQTPQPIVPPAVAFVVPAAPVSRLRTYATIGVLAASVLVALGWFVQPSSSSRQLAQAESELAMGKPSDALTRLAAIAPDRLGDAERATRDKLIETAAYESARSALDGGRFDEVARTVGVSSAAGIESARIRNLKVLGESRIPGEVVLASRGSLLDRGVMPNGRWVVKDTAPPDEATANAWEAAIANYPTDAALLTNYGEFQLARRQLPEAERLFRRAIAADPTYAAAHTGLGIAAFDDNRTDEALAHFITARQLSPNSVTTLVNIAVCYEVKKDDGMARYYWQLVLSFTTDPQSRLRDRVETHLNPK